MEDIMKQMYDPTWFSELDGWKGGSHDDGASFCDQQQRELCSYTVHCPYGDGKPDQKQSFTEALTDNAMIFSFR
ncbi:hypothetical protein ACHAWF_016230 [Thalassiosira exigua]